MPDRLPLTDSRESGDGILSKLRRLLIPIPMARVGLFFVSDDAPAVVSVLARSGACQVSRVPAELQDYLTAYFPDRFREAFRRLRQAHEPLTRRWELEEEPGAGPSEERVPTVEEMDGVSGALESAQERVNEISRKMREGRHREVNLEHFDHYVRALGDLDIDQRALADLGFLHLRVGTVPSENFARLRESAALGEDLVLSLGVKRDRTHVMVIGAGGISENLEGLLEKALFESLISSPVLAEGSDDIDRRLKTEALTIEASLAELQAQDDSLRQQYRPLVRDAARLLARAEVFAACEGAIEGRAPVAFLSGWVPRERLPELERALAEEVPSPVVVTEQPAGGLEDEQPPSVTMFPEILRPGANLVSLYGTPGYDEIDPTFVLTMATPLFFGMMFGDVGYGLLLAITAIGARRWLGQWVPPLVSCGLSSFVFGLAYGSVFGVEEWLPALWLHPMEEPFRLLGVALWIGIGFVLLTFLLKVVGLFRQKRRQQALLGFSGAGGAVFYIGAVLTVRSLYLGESVSPIAEAMTLAGLGLTLVYGAMEVARNGTPALTELAIEYFHGMLNLFANTLSFLRLAAFALAHSALSTALFLVVATIPASGLGWVFRLLALLLGSAVIVVLDLLAVGVQTVRLQFYEGLARFYRGDGRRYQPLQFPRNHDEGKYQTP